MVEMSEKTFGHLPVLPSNGAIVPPISKKFTSTMKTQLVGMIGIVMKIVLCTKNLYTFHSYYDNYLLFSFIFIS